jgi:hypothetical protein
VRTNQTTVGLTRSRLVTTSRAGFAIASGRPSREGDGGLVSGGEQSAEESNAEGCAERADEVVDRGGDALLLRG